MGRVLCGNGEVAASLAHGTWVVQVLGRKGTAHAAAHSAAGLLLLGNVVFSYAFTVRTPPGCSADLPPHVNFPNPQPLSPSSFPCTPP